MSPSKKNILEVWRLFFWWTSLNGANDGKGLIVSFPEVEKTNIHKDPLQLGRISFLVSEDCVCEEGEAFVWGS